MKKPIVFVMVAVFLFGVMSSTASAALMGSWVPTVRSVRGGDATKVEREIVDAVAQLNADLLTFEGLLVAYSVNEDEYLEEQVLLASEEHKLISGIP